MIFAISIITECDSWFSLSDGFPKECLEIFVHPPFMVKKPDGLPDKFFSAISFGSTYGKANRSSEGLESLQVLGFGWFLRQGRQIEIRLSD